MMASVLLAGTMSGCKIEAVSWEDQIALAEQAYMQQRFDEAERLFNAAVLKAEAFQQPDTRLALSLTQLAKLYHAQGRYGNAEPLYLRALGIYELTRGPEHPDVAATLNNLGVLYRMHGQFSEAKPMLERALAIKRKTMGSQHPDVALALSNLGTLYYAQGLYDDAEPLYREALAIREQALGPDHVEVAKSLKEYALLLIKTGRQREAWLMMERVKKIEAKRVGAPFPAKKLGRGESRPVSAVEPAPQPTPDETDTPAVLDEPKDDDVKDEE